MNLDNQDYKNDTRSLEDHHLSALLKNCLTPVYFSMALTDLNQPWFHRTADRTFIESKLSSSPIGTFVIRPSSQGNGCYAMSWVNAEGKVSHNLIYNHFPGYSLQHRVSPDDRVFDTLTQLVQYCNFLTQGLDLGSVPEEKDCEDSAPQVPQTRLVSKLQGNDSLFTSLEWTLTIIENAQGFFNNNNAEVRTCIRYESEEHSAPALFKLQGEVAKVIFESLKYNNSVISIKISGNGGRLMNHNFIPNITDTEVEYLAKSLCSNRSITALDLTYNHITDAGAIALARMLESNDKLKKINLCNNFIGSKGLYCLAYAIKNNATIESFQIANQMVMKLTSITPTQSEYDKFLIQLISNSMKRRCELSLPSSVGFHGYLTPAEAEWRLTQRIQTTKGPYNGHYLFYLNSLAPERICACYTLLSDNTDPSSASNENTSTDPETKILVSHRYIYRTPYGYSFSRKIDIKDLEMLCDEEVEDVVPVPSLTTHCSWFLSANPNILRDNVFSEEGTISEQMAQLVDQTKEFGSLWRMRHIPSPTNKVGGSLLFSPTTTVTYPTLTFLAQRNKDIFKFPVI